MSNRTFKIKLIPLDVSSKDKSVITSDAIREYLSSDAYTARYERSKLAFLGITHKDRKKTNPDYKNIGADDQVLVNKNTVGRINSLYINSKDNYLWGDGEMFDPADFSGQVKEDIQYITGLMKSGSILPASAVVDALWNSKMIAKKVLSIDGADITFNPSFVHAEAELMITS